MGHFLFGMHLASFSSMGGSMLALFKIATGTGDDTSHEHMVQADPAIANLYFLSFIFVVVFILFNILLAIIVDAYGDAAEESRESISIAQDANTAIYRLMYKFSALKGSQRVTSEHLVQAISKLHAQGQNEVSLNELAALCGVHDISAIETHPDIIEFSPVHLKGGQSDAQKKKRNASGAMLL